MTLLEKAMEIDDANNSREEIINCCCPSDYDLEKQYDREDCNCDYEECVKCWNRELSILAQIGE